MASLQAARQLEALADTPRRFRNVVAATGAILLAAHDAGWLYSELADAAGLTRATVYARVTAARRRYNDVVPALVIDAPLARVDPYAVLRRPVDEREWLTAREATEFVQRDYSTIRHWLADGLLPNTTRRGRGKRLYLRADLQRVLARTSPRVTPTTRPSRRRSSGQQSERAASAGLAVMCRATLESLVFLMGHGCREAASVSRWRTP